jgi:thiamine biosynthesis lipoprotein
VLVEDEHRPAGRSAPGSYPTQVVRLQAGAIATSSTTCRQWWRAGRQMHHIVDPRTGQPAVGPWQSASVAAATCAEANAAATAAIVSGDKAADWLQTRQIPARLVSHAGEVLHVAGWSATDGGVLPVSPARMPYGQRKDGDEHDRGDD